MHAQFDNRVCCVRAKPAELGHNALGVWLSSARAVQQRNERERESHHTHYRAVSSGTQKNRDRSL